MLIQRGGFRERKDDLIDKEWNYDYTFLTNQVRTTKMKIKPIDILQKHKYRFNETLHKPTSRKHQTRWQEWNVTIPVDHSRETVPLPFQYHPKILKKIYAKCSLNKTVVVHLSENWDNSATEAGLSLYNYLRKKYRIPNFPDWSNTISYV